MRAKEAIALLERGEAECIETSLLLLRVGDRFYFSFDGRRWDETIHKLVKREFEKND